jgi:hypothetical protein
MNSLKMALPLLLSLGCVPGQAVASTLLGADIQTQIVFADTYVTTGANSTVFGSALSDVATTGANATVTGNLVSVGASTIGANAQLTGNMTAGGVATTGANSTVGGSVQAGGAASTGENSKVVGDISAISPISIGAGGSAGSLGGTVIVPNTLIGTLDAMVKNIAGQITFAQAALSKMVGTLLAPTITTDTTLRSGVYNAASLSTTAGTTLTLDGQGLNDQFWVFNITDILATGASTNIVLLNGGLNNSVIWNTGGYASLGANSNFLGTILADTYVSVGAHTDVTGVGGSCGGIFSATWRSRLFGPRRGIRRHR